MGDNKGNLTGFLSSISTKKGDLSSITAPPYVLATKSAIEYPMAWAEQPSLFTAPASSQDPAERARLVLKWFLASLKRQQYSGQSEQDGAKKPINPFLGEVFTGSFGKGDEAVEMVCEQVSHHPPTTATSIHHAAAGVRAEGFTTQTITISRTFTVTITQQGHAILFIDGFQEAHLQTLPTLQLKSLIPGPPYPELSGESYIVSSTGFTSKIVYGSLGEKSSGGGGFLGMGGGSSERNAFHATLFQTDNPSNVLFTVSGHWNGSFTFYSHRNGKKEEVETYKADTSTIVPIQLPEVSEQDPWESRRAWTDTIAAIERNDYAGTDAAKSRIETAQRAQRAREKEAGPGKEWRPRFFRRVEKDEVYETLAKWGKLSEESVGGELWRVDAKGWEEMTKEENWGRGRWHAGRMPDGEGI